MLCIDDHFRLCTFPCMKLQTDTSGTEKFHECLGECRDCTGLFKGQVGVEYGWWMLV